MEVEGRPGVGAARVGESWWTGPLGDLLAAAVVLIGGGMLGGFGFGGFGFGGLFGGQPPFGGPRDPAPEMPIATQIAGAVVAVLPAAMMFLRRRWPLPVLLVLVGLCVTAVIWRLPTLGPGIGATIAMFALAYRARRRLVFIVASAAAALLILLSFATAGWSAFDMRVFQIGAAVAVSAALGDSARSRREYLSALTERAERAESERDAEARRRVSEERLRIARDLHDAVGHRISVINLNAGLASAKLREQPERAEQSLDTIRRAARGALAEIGDLLRYLRADEDPLPPQVSLEGLDALLAHMEESGLHVDAAIGDGVAGISGSTSGVAYRVVQEGLANAHKHGSERRAGLRIERSDGELRIEIENPIGGAAATDPDALRGGFGLIGLRERVAAIGGTVESGVQGGRFMLSARLPLQTVEEEV